MALDDGIRAVVERIAAAIKGKADRGHTHPVTDLQSGGTLNASLLPDATTTMKGALPLATSAEAQAGTASKLITAASLKAWESWIRPVRSRAVIVGSSNATQSATMWGAKLCAMMGWTEHNYAIGGTAYSSAGSSSFLGQLQTAYAALSVTQRAEVGHVFIVDGSNDGRALTSYGTVKTAAASAYTYASTNFPNALIVVVPMIWPSDTEKYAPIEFAYNRAYTEGMLRVAAAQRDAAGDNPRVFFIDNSWTWLTGRDEFMTATRNVHPGPVGHTYIANMIRKALRGESPIGTGAWTEVTPMSSSFTLGSDDARRLQTMREGGNGFIEGAINSSGATGHDSDWGTIAYGFRPTYLAEVKARASGQTELASVSLWPSGVIRVRNNWGSARTLYITDSYRIY